MGYRVPSPGFDDFIRQAAATAGIVVLIVLVVENQVARVALAPSGKGAVVSVEDGSSSSNLVHVTPFDGTKLGISSLIAFGTSVLA